MKTQKKHSENKQGGKKLTERAGLALKHGFYLEAIWILSALFERRLKKIIGRIENQQPPEGSLLDQSIKRIKYLHVSPKHPDISAFIDLSLIDRVRTWKNQRNEILKDMPRVHVSESRLERAAREGIELYTELSAAGKALKNSGAFPVFENAE